MGTVWSYLPNEELNTMCCIDVRTKEPVYPTYVISPHLDKSNSCYMKN